MKVILLLLGSLVVAKAAPALSSILLGLGLMTVGLAAWNQLCSVLFPGPHARSRRRLEALPLRCFLMGLLTLSLEAWLVAATGAPWLVLPLGLLNLVALSFALPAAAGLAGERIGFAGRWAPAAGSIPLGMSLALPVLGWLCALQVGLAALGAATLPRRWSAA